MVESLKELGPLCQKPRYKEVGNWMVRYILRDLALPITWCLLHTPMTANQVTTIALLVGLLGNLFLGISGSGAFLTGVILLQLWYLLDHVDGQIARYRKTVSLTGRFFDFLMHHVIHGTFFFCVSWTLFAVQKNPAALVLGFTTAFSAIYFNLLSDTKHKTFSERLLRQKQVTISGPEQSSEAPIKTKSNLRKGFSVLHKICEFHVVMNLFTLAAVLEQVLPSLNGRVLLFYLYAVISPVIAIFKTVVWIKTKKIDEEYHSLFNETGD